jgi:predicted ATPase
VSGRHGLAVRTWRDPGGRWYAVADAIPEGVARAAVAGGDLEGSAAAKAERATGSWAAETASGATEAEAVLEAVRLLLARGLGRLDPKGY